MNEPKHTPGPWYIGPNKTQVYDKNVWYDENGIRYGETPNIIIDIEPANPANARLIAAAPEMLEALSRCKNELEELSFYLEAQCIFGTWKATIEKARAAIAKATGEPQI